MALFLLFQKYRSDGSFIDQGPHAVVLITSADADFGIRGHVQDQLAARAQRDLDFSFGKRFEHFLEPARIVGGHGARLASKKQSPSLPWPTHSTFGISDTKSSYRAV